MKSIRVYSVVTALLLSVQAALAFCNPSTGRWLSRDPLGERGGLNLYSFVKNRPIDKFDPTGLAPATWCPFCQCRSVTIAGNPVAPPGVGWYVAGGPGYSVGVYGNLMTITWQVLGDPTKCTYGQDESGDSKATARSGHGEDKTSHYGNHPDMSKWVKISYGLHSATYQDEMGIHFSPPRDNGKWEYTLDLTINFTCTSSDGSKITGATHHFADSGTLYFSGKGDE